MFQAIYRISAEFKLSQICILRPVIFGLMELVTSRRQGNGALCSFDIRHWCKLKQSDFKMSHWLWCAPAQSQTMSLCVGHYQGRLCEKDIVITERNGFAVRA